MRDKICMFLKKKKKRKVNLLLSSSDLAVYAVCEN